jgi:prepilin-type N-terminal cleavage/methylation domain-containing protein
MASRCAHSRSHALRGFTLTEILIAVALLAILASAVVPGQGDSDDRRLELAASEVRETLRFARAEAMRRGKRVLVDAESSPGCLKLFETSCTPFGMPKVVGDPRTKRAFVVKVADGPYAIGVGVTPRFMAAGTAYAGLIFDASGAAQDVCQVTGMLSKGTPQAGSGVLLSLGAGQVSVALDASTGRVTGP